MGKEWNKGDYCTHAPDKILGVSIAHICLEHDMNYIEHTLTRKQSDILLRDKIVHELKVHDINSLLSATVGFIYYFFSRLFGVFYW